MLLRHRAQDRETDRVISTHANAAHPSLQKRSNSSLDSAEGVLYRKRIHWKIAEIRSAVLGEGIYVQHRIPRPDNRRLSANVPRAEARPGAISGPAIERHAYQSHIQLFGLRNGRQGHERSNARKPGTSQLAGWSWRWPQYLRWGWRRD